MHADSNAYSLVILGSDCYSPADETLKALQRPSGSRFGSLWIYQESFSIASHTPLTDRSTTSMQFEELLKPPPKQIREHELHSGVYKAALRHKWQSKIRAQQDDSFAAANFDMQQVC